ncbi:MAG: CDP-alcohol phosphatidyltransferase family protein [Deltaproteobacteria bacterium]|nr:CDP-alcohol phosphatidyltransferase family protein [Deltaproteobacteria bacterium]MBW1967601.1 CDP-alcohol phosphatidyltransferase family protein [Deltaproteobacteria bacterium]
MNIPNLLTLMRIILTPLLVILLINSKFAEALIVFTVAGITDGLDGLIARYMRQKTRIGAILDPIADKLLLTSAYVTLAVVKLLPAWLAVTVISRDVIIVFGVLIIFLFQGGVEIRPSVLGKITTVAQLGTIFVVLVNHELGTLSRFLPFLYVATVLITVISGLHYMYLGTRFLGPDENT